jgi:predicted transposase/invertase (TIGR01784 family)
MSKRTEEHKYEYIISDFTPQNLNGKKIPEIYQHKILYLNPYYINEKTPPSLKDWLELVRESIENPENPNVNRDREIINKAVSIIEESKITSQERALAKDESEWEEVKEEAREEGAKKSEEKTKKEIAKNLLLANVDIEIIIKTTGLSKEEIENLKKNREET